MGTTADKLARLNETKALLKTRLTEKGVDVTSEENFYNLADKVGEIQSGSIIELVNVSFIPSRKTGVLFYTDGSGHYKTIESGSNVIVRVQKNTIVSLEQSSIASNWSGDIEYLENNSFFVYGECLINTY